MTLAFSHSVALSVNRLNFTYSSIAMLRVIMMRSIIQEHKLYPSDGAMALTPMTLNKTALSIMGLNGNS
jgi:hypothetical protein